MSRREFRSELEAPRPVSAFLLVGLASLTLAITGQIAPLSLALQGAALVAAFVLRRRPQPWQQRAVWLNAGLAACALVAVSVALRGQHVSVALAQFALLASGLQLLDARPRRSEFLLVALALFQVVLASSLTDSLLFPPLLVAFLPTCVWTLMVHTLRSEALEAGDPAAASEAITPGLMGTTLVASSLSVVLALLLFFLLPRMHEGLVRAGGPAATALGGFSDRVDLGDLGRIRSDPTVMLRVETVAGEVPPAEERYWRGLAFDRFDGKRWSVSRPQRSSVEGDPALGVILARSKRPPDLVQRILREPVASGVLFGEGEPLRLRGATGRLERDANGGLYAPQSSDARVRYELSAQLEHPDEVTLSRDVATAPVGGERFLALPELSPELRALAQDIVADAPDDAARARQLEQWLRRNGRYSDTPPQQTAGDDRSPLEHFLLGELSAHCEYFASAMVVLARSVGLPARLVNGFAGGRMNRVGDFVELVGSDAHAWVEIHFRDHGWVRFDPTPPDLRLGAFAGGTSLLARFDELRSALELLWFQHVVEFDRAQQARAVIQAWRTVRDWLPRDDATRAPVSMSDWLERLRSLSAVPLVAAVLLCAMAFLLWRALRPRAPVTALPRAYARALRVLARHGYVRTPARTPRAFARDVCTRLRPEAAAAFQALTEAYLRQRYGGCPAPPGDAELRVLRDSLRG